MSSECLSLSTGASMPCVGLGTWQSTSPAEVETAVKTALDAGYRLIDTAEGYENEQDIGRALDTYFHNNKLTRKDVFITTKVWCTHNRPDEIEGQLKASLSKLQTEYVDLYLVHMPGTFSHDMSAHEPAVSLIDTWRGMEAVFEKGLAKAIGLSNFNAEQIQRVYDSAKVKPHNLQVEAHLYLPQTELVELCTKLHITVTSYASLGSPGRTNFKLPGGAPLTWAPAPDSLQDPIVVRLAQKHGKTSAQILLRWLRQREIATIPKSTNPDRIRENFHIWDFALTAEEMAELNAVKTRHRLFVQDFLIGHPEDPFKDER